ncbi:uncharacterized protein LOC121368362 isoform X3 [Gigantopelta aegis]|uniref:uncharacterized protein LOC121368362 isoform X3 n=1 Tax=Gigantopelta aegis TaxID=1735272 RepID=UPI001B88E5FC|nr:uncharacterized protein LOC121368362 isoform X3 [Gigantopelta aegis]
MFRNVIFAVTIIILARTDVLDGAIPPDVCAFFEKVNCSTFRPRLICASDGTTFPNDCEFGKRRCVDESVHVLIDGQVCPTTPPEPSTISLPSWCRVLLAQSCDSYPPRIICGSDGITYSTACHFSKAHCHNPSLNVTYDGKGCFFTLTSTSHPVITTSGNLLSTVAVIDLSCNITNQLICDDYAPKFICASNGQTYRTECDFAKEHCKNTSLKIIPDGHGCSVTTFSTAATVITQKTQAASKTAQASPTAIPDTSVKLVTHTTKAALTATTAKTNTNSGKTVTHKTQTSHTAKTDTTSEKTVTHKTQTSHTATTAKIDTTSGEIFTHKTQASHTVTTAKTDTTSGKILTQRTQTSHTATTAKTDSTSEKISTHKTQTSHTPTTAKTDTTSKKILTHKTQASHTPTTAKPQITKTSTISAIPKPTPTPKSSFDLLCRLLMSFECNKHLNVVCTTNGNYRNTCELEKTKCLIHGIEIAACPKSSS